VAALAVLAGAAVAAAVPTPTARRRPPDFSGVWRIDETASRGISDRMRGAVLRVEQSGDRIRIFPLGEGDKLVADEVIADGRPYEKSVGNGKGVLTARWSADRESLWLEVAAGPPEEPRAAVQRSVWRLSDGGKTWVRQSVTLQSGERAEATLVFRKTQSATRSRTRSPTPVSARESKN
jgi:hypothetical protein